MARVIITTNRTLQSGRIAVPRQNFLPNSNDLTQAFYVNVGITPTVAAGTPNPIDGATNVNLLSETTSVGVHTNQQIITAYTTTIQRVGQLCCVSAYLKQGTQRYAGVRFGVAVGTEATADLQTGKIVASVSALATGCDAVNGKPGWYRVWAVGALDSIGVCLCQVFLESSASIYGSYAGNAANNVYCYQMQFVIANWPGDICVTAASAIGTATPPRSIVPKQNLILQSQAFNLSWTGVQATGGAPGSLAPDGTNTACVLSEDNTVNIHYLFSTPFFGRSGSVFAKPNGRDYILVSLDGTAANGAYFNLATGQLGTVGAGVTASIVQSTNGFYRCSIVRPSSASYRVYLFSASADNVVNFAGNNGPALLVWGAQAVNANWAGDYAPTTAATLNIGAPRSIP